MQTHIAGEPLSGESPDVTRPYRDAGYPTRAPKR